MSEDAYVRRRLAPTLGDLDRLPLRDLLSTVRRLAESASGRLFDYGCGGTPYRDIFKHCDEYIGADIVAGPCVDRVLGADGLTGEFDGNYDTVFSSQVLEHVPDPAIYLAEAFRILRPGGHLILTTHGMFLEHGCPNDFFRWTGYGLERAVIAAGFEPLETLKITPGARASIYLIHIAIETARAPTNAIARGALAIFRRAWRLIGHPALNGLAEILDRRPHVPGNAPEPVYVGVGVLARRPASCGSPS